MTSDNLDCEEDDCILTLYSKKADSVGIKFFQYKSDINAVSLSTNYFDFTTKKNQMNQYQVSLEGQKWVKIQVTYESALDKKKEGPGGEIVARLQEMPQFGSNQSFQQANDVWYYEFNEDMIVDKKTEKSQTKHVFEYNLLISKESSVGGNFKGDKLYFYINTQKPITYLLSVETSSYSYPTIQFNEKLSGLIKCQQMQNLIFKVDKNRYKSLKNQLVMFNLKTQTGGTTTNLQGNTCKSDFNCGPISDVNNSQAEFKSSSTKPNEEGDYQVQKLFLPVKCTTQDNFCYFNLAYGLDQSCDVSSSIPYDLEMLTNNQIKIEELPDKYKPKKKSQDSKDVKSKDHGVDIPVGQQQDNTQQNQQDQKDEQVKSKDLQDQDDVEDEQSKYIKLETNIPYYGNINWGEEQIFQYDLPKDKQKDLQYVSFGSNNENLQLYITQDPECEKPQCADFQGMSVNIEKSQIKKLSKSFYIRIKAHESISDFTMVAYVTQTESFNAISLEESYRLQSYVSVNNPRYFQTKKETAGKKDIIVQGAQDLIILVNNNGLFANSLKNKYQCISYKNYISINKQSKCYNSDGDYYITVLQRKTPVTNKLPWQQFFISTVSGDSVQKISLNHPLNDFVQEKSTKKYQITFDPQSTNFNVQLTQHDDAKKNLGLFLNNQLNVQDERIKLDDTGFVSFTDVMRLCKSSTDKKTTKINNTKQKDDDEDTITEKDEEKAGNNEEESTEEETDKDEEKKEIKKQEKQNKKQLKQKKEETTQDSDDSDNEKKKEDDNQNDNNSDDEDDDDKNKEEEDESDEKSDKKDKKQKQTDDEDEDDDDAEQEDDRRRRFLKVNKKQKDKQSTVQLCSLFIEVENNNAAKKKLDVDLKYQLNVVSSKYATKILEGRQANGSFHPGKGSQNYYFIPNNKNKELYLQIASYESNLSVQFMIYKNDDDKPVYQWPFNDLSKKTAINETNHHINYSISPESLSSCWPKCAILVKVKNSDEKQSKSSILSYIKGDKKKKTKAQNSVMYEIQITGVNDFVTSNDAKIFHLNKDQSKYFFFNLKQVIRDKADIICALTAFHGKVSIYAEILDHDDVIKDKHQSEETEASWSTSGNYLEIPYSDIEKKIKKLKDPYFVVEINETNGARAKVQLLIMNSKEDYINLIHGLPQQFNLSKSSQEQVTFRYFHYSKKNFSIRLSKSSGYGDVKIYQNKCCDSKNEIKTEQVWSGNQFNVDMSKYPRNQEYFINVKEQDISINFSVTILLEGDPIYIQEGYNFRDQVISSQFTIYKLAPKENKSIYIEINKIAGNIDVYSFTQLPKNIKNQLTKDNQVENTVTILDNFIKFKVSPVKHRKKSNILIHSYVYVVIQNNQYSQADFTIQYTDSDSFQTIQDGQMKAFEIQPNTSTSILYEHQALADHIDSLLAQVQYTMPNDKKYKTKKLDIKKETLTVQQKSSIDDNKYVKKDFQIQATHDNMQNYEIQSVNGTYKFTFNNKNKYAVVANMLINSNDIILAPLGETLVQLQFVKNQFRFFEYQIPNDGFVYLYTKQCQGDYNLLITQDTQKFQKVFQSKKMPQKQLFESGTYLDDQKVKKGTLYVAIQNLKKVDSYISIKVNYYKSIKNKVLHKLQSGKQGMLSVKSTLGKKLSILFYPVVCNQCTEKQQKQLKVKYRLVYSDSEEAFNVFGRCQALQFYDTKKQKTEIKSQYIPEDALTNEGYFLYLFDEPNHNKYHLTIVAEIVGSTQMNKESHDLFYTSYMYDRALLHKWTFMQSFAALGVIFVVLFLCASTTYYLRKLKRASKALTHMKIKNQKLQKGTEMQGLTQDDQEIEDQVEKLISKPKLTGVINYNKIQQNYVQKSQDLQDKQHDNEELML